MFLKWFTKIRKRKQRMLVKSQEFEKGAAPTCEVVEK